MASKLQTGQRFGDFSWDRIESIDDDQIVRFVDDRVTHGKIRRQYWELEARMQLAWAEGNQFETNPKAYTVDRERIVDAVEDYLGGEPRDYDKKFPMRVNHMLPIAFQKIAMIMGGPLSFDAAPENESDAAEQSAKVQTKLARYAFTRGGNPARREQIYALWETLIAGSQWIHTKWNPYGGEVREFRFDPTVNESAMARRERMVRGDKELAEAMRATHDPEKLSEGNRRTLALGDADWEYVSPFFITEPPGVHRMSKCYWLIHSQWEHIDELRFVYGAAAKEIEPCDEEPYWDHVGMNSAVYRNDDRASGEVPAELVLTHTLWVPVLPWTPYGGCVKIAQKKLLHKGPNAHAHGRLPFTLMQEQPSRWFRPRCSGFQMMTMQRGINQVRSMQMAHANDAVAPKIMAEEGANIPDNFFDTEKRVLRVPKGTLSSGNRNWEYFQPPPYAFSVDRISDQLERDLQGQQNIHDSSQGASSAKSGRHAAFLLQRDSQGQFVPRFYLQSALEDAMVLTLWDYWQFASVERTVQITGDAKRNEVLSFKGKDLVPEGSVSGPYGFQVRTMLGADLQPADRIQLVLDLVGVGFYDTQNPEHRQEISRVLGDKIMPDFDKAAPHKQRQWDEIRLIVAGAGKQNSETVAPVLGDDDVAHLEVIDHYMTTGEYRRAVDANNAVATEIEAHRWAHYYNMFTKLEKPKSILKVVEATTQQEATEELRGEGLGVAENILGAPPQGVGAPPQGAENAGLSDQLIPQGSPEAVGAPPQGVGAPPQGVGVPGESSGEGGNGRVRL